MIKHKVKYRVVGADRSKRKYSINLDDGASFHLSRELLLGTPAQEGSSPVCSFIIQNNLLRVRSGADQSDFALNGKATRETEARPGDLLQVGEFSIEILECPHQARSESNSTQFLDVSEMFANSSEPKQAAPEPKAAAEPAVATENPTQTETPKDKWSSNEWDAASSDQPIPVAAPSIPAAAARTRASHDESRDHEEISRSTPSSRARSGSHRDTERFAHAHSPSHVHARTTKRRPGEGSKSSISESDFSHLAMSAGMAAIGVAATTRVLVNASSTPQGMIVACTALSSIPVVLGLAWSLSRANTYLETDAHLRDYARFLSWSLICSVPWAYTQAASFPIAVFTTLLTTVLLSVAFIGRFRPNMGRYSTFGAGLSAFALACLFTFHHYAAEKLVAQEPLNTDSTSSTDLSTTTSSSTVATAPVAATSPAPAPAALAAPAAAAPAAPQPLQANAAPLPPSSVTDTIPPIPGHVDTSLTPTGTAGNVGTQGRTPAAVDPSAKGIIDPLAHEEFFSAIKTGNLEVVRSLIDRKQVDPDFTLDKGSTPLIVAAASGRLKVAEYLVRRRVNINAQDPHGTTALMWAVFKGHRDVAKFLISKGADAKVIRDDGDTAMDIARKWRQTEIVALLKDASKQDDVGHTKKSRSSSRKRRH